MTSPAKRKKLSDAPEAIDAGAERLLGDMKAKRVAKAESALQSAREALAAAELEEQQAAAAMANNPAARARLVEASDSVKVAASMVSHYERQAAIANQRWSAEHKQAALTMVEAERERASLMGRLDPVLAQLTDSIVKVIDTLNEAFAMVRAHHDLNFDRVMASEQLGIVNLRTGPNPLVPNLSVVTSIAAFRACQQTDFSPSDLEACLRASSGGPIPAYGSSWGGSVNLNAETRDQRLHEMEQRRRAWNLQKDVEAQLQGEQYEAERAQRRADQEARRAQLTTSPGVFNGRFYEERTSLAED